jgi:hypothetical protein
MLATGHDLRPPTQDEGGGLRKLLHYVLRGRNGPNRLADGILAPPVALNPEAFRAADVAQCIRWLGAHPSDAWFGGEPSKKRFDAITQLVRVMEPALLCEVMLLLDFPMDEFAGEWLESVVSQDRVASANLANAKALELRFSVTLVLSDLDHTAVRLGGEQPGLQPGYVDAIRLVLDGAPDDCTRRVRAFIPITGRIDGGADSVMLRMPHDFPWPTQIKHGAWPEALRALSGDYRPLNASKANYILEILDRLARHAHAGEIRAFFFGDRGDAGVVEALANHPVECHLIDAGHGTPSEPDMDAAPGGSLWPSWSAFVERVKLEPARQ